MDSGGAVEAASCPLRLAEIFARETWRAFWVFLGRVSDPPNPR